MKQRIKRVVKYHLCKAKNIVLELIKRSKDNLFRKIGYVPNEKYNELLQKVDKSIEKGQHHIICVLKGNIQANYNWCKINDTKYRTVVFITDKEQRFRVIIKAFISEDLEYARICAEELVDMLNEKY